MDATRVCSIDGCEKKVQARGWCLSHYRRWLNHGDPMGGRAIYPSPELAFAARTEWRGNCLIWTGGVSTSGYGTLRFDGASGYAHRYAFQRVHGSIPEGMHIDHTCWDGLCCNVEHLRLTTPKQNGENRSGPSKRNKSSGLRNVTWDASREKWHVSVNHNRVRHNVGRYESLEEAAIAAAAKRAELFTHSQY